MRSRMFAHGVVAASSIAVLGLFGGPAWAVDVPPADAVTAETDTLLQTDDSGEDDATGEAVDQVLDDVDETVETTGDAVDQTTDTAPDPVSSTTDDAVDTTTDTVTTGTDAVRQTLGTSDGAPDPDVSTGGGGDQTKGAGSDPSAAPAPAAGPTATSGSPVAGGGVPSRAPARIALDGFRRTSGFNDASPEVAVFDGPGSDPEPAFAPPTTRDVVEPVAAAPRLPLRTVAVEILVAAALLVLATGSLVAELGPERA